MKSWYCVRRITKDSENEPIIALLNWDNATVEEARIVARALVKAGDHLVIVEQSSDRGKTWGHVPLGLFGDWRKIFSSVGEGFSVSVI